MPKQKTVSQFLSNHLWQIILLALAGIVAFLTLKGEVAGIITRVIAVENKVTVLEKNHSEVMRSLGKIEGALGVKE